MLLYFTYKYILKKGIIGLFILFDGVFYKIASMLYSLFYKLATLQLLGNEFYETMANRIYLLVGLIALFSFSVSLLKSLVDPDNLNKTVVKSFKTLITSIFLIILMPTIFTYIYSIQAAVLGDRLIESFFNVKVPSKDKNGQSNVPDYSLIPISDYCDPSVIENVGTLEVKDQDGNMKGGTYVVTENQCRANFIIVSVLEAFFSPISSGTSNQGGTSWAEARKYMIYTGEFNYISSFAHEVYDGTGGNAVTYYPLVSTAGAIFLCYIFLTFCIDLGIRCAKLAFYQIISPIPVLMRMIPGKEGQFDKWMKNTISCFLEVFVRIGVISFVVFMAQNLMTILNGINFGGQSINLLGKAIIVMGLFAFAKQAPKLLGDALGFDGGNLSLGIKKKISDTPILGKAYSTAKTGLSYATGVATGALGAAYTSKINGGSFWEGAKYGAANSYKHKGNQFGAQRQAIYKTMGFGGQAGLFGGRAWLDKKIADTKDSYKDNYLDQILPGKIKEMEKSQEYTAAYNRKLAELQDAPKKEMARLQGLIAPLMAHKNSDLQSLANSEAQAIDEINKEYAKWDNDPDPYFKIEKDGEKAKKIEALKKDFQTRRENMTADYDAQKQHLESQIAAIKSQLEDKTVSRKVYEFNQEKGKYEIVSRKFNALEEEARKTAVSEFEDKNVTYKAMVKSSNDRIREKDRSQWLKSDDGMKAQAIFKETFGESGKIPVPPPSGGASGEKNNNSGNSK